MDTRAAGRSGAGGGERPTGDDEHNQQEHSCVKPAARSSQVHRLGVGKQVEPTQVQKDFKRKPHNLSFFLFIGDLHHQTLGRERVPLFGWMWTIFTEATTEHRPCAAYTVSPTHTTRKHTHTHTHMGQKHSSPCEGPLKHVIMCVPGSRLRCHLGEEPGGGGKQGIFKVTGGASAGSCSNKNNARQR